MITIAVVVNMFWWICLVYATFLVRLSSAVMCFNCTKGLLENHNRCEAESLAQMPVDDCGFRGVCFYSYTFDCTIYHLIC